MTDIQCSKWWNFAVGIIILVYIGGCSNPSPAPTETLLPEVSPSSTASAPRTSQSPTPTHPAPSATPSPTLSPSPMASPARTSSPTPRPTLTTDEEYRYVREMLATNGECELPCWWGITPGETSRQEAKNRLPYLNFWFDEKFGGYYIRFTLTTEKDLTQSIKVRSYRFADDDSRFAEDWQRYSLDQVLNRYGPPSRARIVLALPIDAGGPTDYTLYMFYDELGVSVIYMGPATKKGEMLSTCFSFHNITLQLQPPESSTPLEQAIDPYEWDYAVPLDEATGMSMEEFYETFRQYGACLEAPPTFP